MNKNPLNSRNFASTIANGTTLVDFWAPWCGYCRRIAPAVESLADELAGKVTVAGVNVDDEPALAQQYRIDTIPALLLFKDGVQVGAPLIGPGSKAAITNYLKENGAL